MIKNIILVIISLSFCGCAIGAQGRLIDSSINPADQHAWVPGDEEELEKRRIRQAHFDAISKDMETLFLKFDTIVPRETNMRAGTKDFIPEIGSLDINIADQITKEQKRIHDLSKEIERIRLNNKQIKNQMVSLSLAPVFTKDQYISAYHYFRKGQYIKSAKLFENINRLNPPHSLVDNILFGLSMSYYKVKKFSSAMKPLYRVIKEYPNSDKWYMSHVMLALIHERRGEKSQALYILEQGLSNDPPYFILSMIKTLIDLVQGESI